MMDVSTAEARRNLADLLNRVAYTKERVIVQRRGRDVAAIVPMEDVALLDKVRQLLTRQEVVDALDELDRGASIAWSDLKDEVGL